MLDHTTSAAKRAGDAGARLFIAVRAAHATLEGLLRHGPLLGEDVHARLTMAGRAVGLRMERTDLHIAVVGEQKSGKSTFLNAVLGYPLLGTAVRECTGTVTRVRGGERPDWAATLVDGSTRTCGIAAPAARGGGSPEARNAYLRAVAAEVAELGDMARSGRNVARLDVTWPAARLPAGVVLLDTPGVNTDDAANRERAWDAIREDADGCVVVSDITQALSMSTREFVHALSEYVPHVVLVLTKVDQALENALFDGEEEATAQVAGARRVAVRRFAKELGRAPEDVFTLAVAAEPALKGAPGASAAFGAEVDALFAFLQEERVLVLAARCAAALELATRNVDEAVARAEETYRARLAHLEAQRIPNAAAFRAQTLARLPGPLADAKKRVRKEARKKADETLSALYASLMAELRNQLTASAVEAWSKRLGDRLPGLVAAALEQAHPHATVSATATALERTILDDLRERYRIAERIAGVGLAERARGSASAGAAAPALDMASTVSDFDGTRLVLGAGGAAAGALIGSMVLPGLGTVVGAVLGSFARLMVSVDDLRRDCGKSLTAWFTKTGDALLDGAADRAEAAVDALPALLEARLDEELARFATWIEQVIAAERAAIAAERREQAHLRAAGETTARALAELQAARAEAFAWSGALCAARGE